MNIPYDYASWIKCFEILKSSPKNLEYIEILKKGKLESDNILLGKFIDSLDEVFKTRLTNAFNKFINHLQTSITNANIFQLDYMEFKKEFKYLYELTNLPVLPKDVNIAFKKNLQEHANEVEKILKNDLASFDRTGIYINIIKNNPINKLEV